MKRHSDAELKKKSAFWSSIFCLLCICLPGCKWHRYGPLKPRDAADRYDSQRGE